MGRKGLTKPQVVALLIVNALVSLIISLTVVLAFERYRAANVDASNDTSEHVVMAQAPTEVPPSPTPTSSSSEPVATYVVKKGDSLSGIAYKLGISMRALMEANDIDDADYIKVGQTLVVPGDLQMPVATETRERVPTLPPILTPEGSDVPVVITAIVSGRELSDEQVTIVNRGTKGVALEGWVLEDGDGHVYTFPDLFLWRNGTVFVHTGMGTDSVTDLYWGLTESVWDKEGEVAVLRDAKGDVVCELAVTWEGSVE